MPTLKDIQERSKIEFAKYLDYVDTVQGLGVYRFDEKVIDEIIYLAFQAGIDMVLKEIEERLGGFEDTTFEPQHKEYNDGYNQALSSLKGKIISNSK
jgi:hypothetical protein